MGDAGFDGAVLCGGASRRMGRDKALIEIDGVPMAERVATALRQAGAGAVMAVGGEVSHLHFDVYVPDRWPGEGPLGGVVTALEVASSDVVVVLSCDLVAPDAGSVSRLVAARSTVDSDVAVAVADGREQWTFAVWHTRIRPLARDAFDAGERALRSVARDCVVERVGLPPGAVADADRPQDLP